MVKVGVIAEYNPFHNGHLYHLKKVKELYPDSYLVLVLIGNFTQRGEISIIDKWDKTKIALEYGFDLVVELPFIFATQSASYYAKGAIRILDYLNCDYLVFGSESNDVKTFMKLSDIMVNNEDYDKKVKKYVNKGINYPLACSKALYDITKIIIDKPNDVLALEYVKNIKKYNSKMIPVSIKRTNDYHEEEITKNITSATSIRKNINNTGLINKVMPEDVIKYIKNINYDKYFELIKYQVITSSNLNEYVDVDEGIENRLKNILFSCNNLNDLILKTKSKRYSYNKISRMLLHIVCKIKKDDNNLNIKYIRVLGLNNNGKKILKEVKNKINIPIITKYKKEYDELFKTDIIASKIYGLITNYDYKEDYKSSIIKKC